MFSSALKSFSSNISNNYQYSPNPSFISGPWKVHDGKNKNSGKAVSIFIFDRKSLDPRAGGLVSRSNATSVKKAHEEVVERLKREAANLARLRHPSILQIIEPVEDTRNGGLIFATEAVTASLSGLLQEKTDQELSSRVGGRVSRHMIEDADGSRRRRDLEIDELEIQKGLLQIGKGLEFLHESAKIVHGNLTPDAIYINAKSDWKISGLSFAGPTNPDSQSPLPSLALSEALYYDPRLPRSVQLDLDYTSPDFVMDSNVSSSADLFSLGLIIVALFNSPHISPLKTNNSTNTYKKLLSSSSTIPSQSNSFLSSGPIPKDLANHVLPKLITRRPAQRMNASEFQQSQYFDNVLVSTIRFLDTFPAKTQNEKSQFMRGLSRILPEFPTSVLERKVLGALLEESKDRELLPLILQNVFKIILRVPSSQRLVPDKVLPRLKEIFLPPSGKGAVQERDTTKDAGLMVLLENTQALVDNCSGKVFKDEVIPLILLGLDSPTHSLVDASMKCLPIMLPVLDYTTVKDSIFPPIASVFARTSSLAIKVRGLEAFCVLCGGSSKPSIQSTDDDLSGIITDTQTAAKSSSNSILDKYTIQEKLIPLLKAIKTKEPAVMVAALNVFKQIGHIVDIEFAALEVLPILWSFALGPLLNVQQFSSFMEYIKLLSSKIEREQTKKLQQLSSGGDAGGFSKNSTLQTGRMSPLNNGGEAGGDKSDFERLVLGKNKASSPSIDSWGDWGDSSTTMAQTATKTETVPQFSWSSGSTAAAAARQGNGGGLAKPNANLRSITPDTTINSFPTLQPGHKSNTSSLSSMATLQPLSPQAPQGSSMMMGNHSFGAQQGASQFNASSTNSFNIPTIGGRPVNSGSSSWQSQGQMNTMAPLSPYTIAPPPQSNNQFQRSPSATSANTTSAFSNLSSPPAATSNQQQKQGLDKYDSLL
ncbi:SCY1 protein kinase [Trichophyton tonsurans CBS 112818]|uniref:SCY1 protein kinase n=1 Tax=Trichophyton tonsurans (strain CBS 112818) TaxID=647933 RepID=F2S551_TRIT1|nr:SCY1 protein kinase [Trichophyton tonsurans CBS 112818]